MIESPESSGAAPATDQACAVEAAGSAPPPRRRRGRAFLGCALVLAAVGAALWFGHQRVLRAVPSWFDDSDPPQRVDAVMVLGGGVDARPFGAAEMFKAGLAPKIIVPRPEPATAIQARIVPPQEVLTQRVLERYGVKSADMIVLPSIVTSTRDEARALDEYLGQHPQHRVAVVTHDYHTRRTRRIFADECGDRIDRLVIVGVPLESFHDDDWWKTPDGWGVYGSEAIKLGMLWTGLDR